MNKQNFIKFLRLLSAQGSWVNEEFWHLSDATKQKEVIAKLPFTKVGRLLPFELAIQSAMSRYLDLIDGTSYFEGILFPGTAEAEHFEEAIILYIQEKEKDDFDSEEIVFSKSDPSEALLAQYREIDPRHKELWEIGKQSFYEMLRGDLWPGPENEENEQFLSDVLWRLFHLRMISEKCADFSPEERVSALTLNTAMHSLMQTMDEMHNEN